MQMIIYQADTPERQWRADLQGLPRPYSPPIAHPGSNGQPWHELQEQPSSRSDTSDPWDDQEREWSAEAALKPKHDSST